MNLPVIVVAKIELTALARDTYNFVIDISTGKIKHEEMTEWIKNNSTMIE